MKKTSKKILAMVLALMMILSLGVTAFAAEEPDGVVTIIISATKDENTKNLKKNFDFTTGETIYQVIEANKETFTENGLEPHWKDVPDYYNPNIMYKALESMGTYATVGVNDAPGYTVKKWIEGRPGYGLISEEYDAETGKTTYTYIYSGYAWTYSVFAADAEEPVEPDVYMDQYKLQDGDEVTLTYKLSVTEWTTMDEIKPLT